MNLSELNSPVRHVHNRESGYSLVPDHIEWRWGFYPEQVWRFRINQEAPLTVELESRVQIMPNFQFTTNLGSIPIPFRLFFPKDEFPLEYALHDDEYNRHGIFAKPMGATSFVFVPTERDGADLRLYNNIITISKGSVSRARKIFLGVRYGGSIPWAMGRTREAKIKGLMLC